MLSSRITCSWRAIKKFFSRRMVSSTCALPRRPMMPTFRNCSMGLSKVDGLRRLWAQAAGGSKPDARVLLESFEVRRYADAMNPFSHLSKLPRLLQQPAVRDLAWTLIAPPLLSDALWPQRHPLAASDWAQVPEQLADWLQRLDQDPSALDAWLARASNRRLGLYYEKLWQFALQAAPGVELLAANVAIRQGGQTLGEMDLL